MSGDERISETTAEAVASSAVEADARAILNRAADLVERGWCKNSPARDARGLACSAYASRAVRFCASGAIERAYYESYGDVLPPNLTTIPLGRDIQDLWLAAHGRDKDLPQWNNHRASRDPVVEALRLAASAATGERTALASQNTDPAPSGEDG